MNKESLIERDMKSIWHPYAVVGKHELPIVIERASGACYYDIDGNKIIDGISSWWVNIHGHCHPHIAKAIVHQISRIDQIIFSGFTHEPAIALSERLLKLLPANMHKIFFSDNGSTAIEIGIKMAVQYFRNRGIEKKKLLAFENAFHGETFGAMAAGGVSAINSAFSDMLFSVDFIPVPNDDNLGEVLNRMDRMLAEGDYYGFIFEPLLQGSGGMLVHKAAHLDQLIRLCRKHQVVTIADEVLTGFGRTGKVFASDYLEEKPDIICLSKGLTGGTLPLAVTSVCREVFDAFDTDDKTKALYHGHSYTGNPIACAAALAAMDLTESPTFSAHMERITRKHAEFAEKLKAENKRIKVRQQGTVIAFEFLAGDEAGGYLHPLRDQLYAFFLERHILLRPLGNVIYILPPMCISDSQLDLVYSAISESIDTFLP